MSSDPRDPAPPPDDDDVTRVDPRNGASPADPETEVTRVERVERVPLPPDEEETVVERVERWPDGPVVEERIEPAGPPPPEHRDLWPWLLLLLLLVLGGLAAWWFFARGGDETTVPRAVGLREAAAVAAVEEAGLEPVVSRRPSSRPEGVVFAQRPGAGSQLEEGEAVELQVSAGPQSVVLPNLVGLPRQQALDRLREVPSADFDVRESGVFSEQPKGIVVAQDPPAGERIPSDATVRINVSQGTGRVTVPDVVGSTVDEATTELRQLGLTANPADVPSSEPEGTVVAQSPAAGSEVAQGDSVRLNVSTGEGGATTPGDTTTTGAGTSAVPDVVGLTREQAIPEVGAAGFRVQAVSQSTPDEAEDGLVVRQDPAAGRRAETGSVVTLYVGEFSP